MNYKEFKERIGELATERNNHVTLLEGQDSIHFVCALGRIFNDEYEINISSYLMKKFVYVLDLVESRGAIRGEDFIVVCFAKEEYLQIAIHTTRDFLSDEDFEGGIKRIWT